MGEDPRRARADAHVARVDLAWALSKLVANLGQHVAGDEIVLAAGPGHRRDVSTSVLALAGSPSVAIRSSLTWPSGRPLQPAAAPGLGWRDTRPASGSRVPRGASRGAPASSTARSGGAR